MKKQLILNYVLATTVVVLLFYIRTSADSNEVAIQPTPGGITCNYSTAGFAREIVIERTIAAATAARYKSGAIARGDSIWGGVISKATLDSLFCSGNFNGLAYRLASDHSGQICPQVSNFIIVSGVKLVSDPSGNPSIADQSKNSYIPNLWCPPNCANY